MMTHGVSMSACGINCSRRMSVARRYLSIHHRHVWPTVEVHIALSARCRIVRRIFTAASPHVTASSSSRRRFARVPRVFTTKSLPPAAEFPQPCYSTAGDRKLVSPTKKKLRQNVVGASNIGRQLCSTQRCVCGVVCHPDDVVRRP